MKYWKWLDKRIDMNNGFFILILNFDLKQKWNNECYSIAFIEAVDRKLANRPYELPCV